VGDEWPRGRLIGAVLFADRQRGEEKKMAERATEMGHKACGKLFSVTAVATWCDSLAYLPRTSTLKSRKGKRKLFAEGFEAS
jgi:hypothetical protein